VQNSPPEPFDDAAKVWTPPATTQLCEVKITDGGWIIANNLDRVAARLEALEAAKGDAVFQQGNFIAFYIGRMNVQIDLAKLQLKVGEHTIDFAALVRSGTAMAELTEDFFATITAWAGQVSERITSAARTVSRKQDWSTPSSSTRWYEPAESSGPYLD